jgi:hypothetical protein
MRRTIEASIETWPLVFRSSGDRLDPTVEGYDV